MTRKDYVMLANVIKAQRKPHNDTETINEIALSLADVLEEDNPNFDRVRFLWACELQTETPERVSTRKAGADEVR